LENQPKRHESRDVVENLGEIRDDEVRAVGQLNLDVLRDNLEVDFNVPEYAAFFHTFRLTLRF
jgi:hypothetical protein